MGTVQVIFLLMLLICSLFFFMGVMIFDGHACAICTPSGFSSLISSPIFDIEQTFGCKEGNFILLDLLCDFIVFRLASNKALVRESSEDYRIMRLMWRIQTVIILHSCNSFYILGIQPCSFFFYSSSFLKCYE